MVQIVDTSTITTTIALSYGSPGDEILVLDGVNIIGTNQFSGNGIYMSGGENVAHVHGFVHGGRYGVRFGAADNVLIIGPTGRVTSNGDAVLATSGSGTAVTNYGFIHGDAYGLRLWNAPDLPVSLVNHGTISGAGSAGAETGIGSSVNYGTITGATGVRLTGAADDENHFTNHGAVTGVNGVGINSTARVVRVENHGTVDGNVRLIGLTSSDFTNTGVVAGSYTATGWAADDVVNSGLITGDVLLGRSDDRFDGRGGTVLGEVAGGEGDDLYIIDDATPRIVELPEEGMDTIRSAAEAFELPDHVEVLELIGNARAGYGNDADNLIRGNLHDNVLAGRLGNDTIEGGDGRDLIYGGAGNDLLRGEDGDDYIRGGPGDDLMGGGDGDDFLQGSEGADSLYGGAGEDRLWGGMGPDVLYGGADADTFAFAWVAESPGGAGRDRIMDFERGLDRIDLANVDADATIAGNQAFQFIGTAAFSAAGQLRYAVVGPDVIVGADVDGDGVGDLTILVAGVTALAADDFIL